MTTATLTVGQEVRLGVSIAWGKYPAHLSRTVRVTYGKLTMLDEALSPDSISKAQKLVSDVLGDEGADIVKALGQISIKG